jgi:hypothetical protein
MSARDSQHYMWSCRFRVLVVFLDTQDPADYSPEVPFAVQRTGIDQLWEKCANIQTFEAQCTREKLTMLCDMLRRVVDSGAVVKDFPEWSYVVTQFHLFVMDAELQANMAPMEARVETLERSWYQPRAKKKSGEGGRLGALLGELEQLSCGEKREGGEAGEI